MMNPLDSIVKILSPPCGCETALRPKGVDPPILALDVLPFRWQDECVDLLRSGGVVQLRRERRDILVVG